MLSQSFAVAAVVAGLSELGHEFLVVEASREAKKPKKDKSKIAAPPVSAEPQQPRSLVCYCDMPEPPLEISHKALELIDKELREVCECRNPNAPKRHKWGQIKGGRASDKIHYFYLDDSIAHKHWRVYLGISSTEVAVLDIFDKDDDRIPKTQLNRLWGRYWQWAT